MEDALRDAKVYLKRIELWHSKILELFFNSNEKIVAIDVSRHTFCCPLRIFIVVKEESRKEIWNILSNSFDIKHKPRQLKDDEHEFSIPIKHKDETGQYMVDIHILRYDI
jgi:hypothetical protein